MGQGRSRGGEFVGQKENPDNESLGVWGNDRGQKSLGVVHKYLEVGDK